LDARAFKAVIDRQKPQRPTPRLLQRGRWQVDRQRNIPVHEGLALRGAKDNQMDTAKQCLITCSKA
jgi:hypothetical protein